MRVKRNLVTLLPLLALAGLVVVPSDTRSVLFYALGVSAAFIGFSHVTRKLLFPYVDLEAYFNEALRGNMAAAVVVLAVCGVLSAVIVSSISLLR